MSEKQYRDQITSLTKDLAALRKDDATAKSAASKARGEAASYRRKINPKTSASVARSYESSAKSADRRAETSEKKVAELARKIADRISRLNTAETNLARERGATSRKADQADARRRRAELDHARRVSQVSRSVVRHVYEVREVPPPRAEELRVLYLTSNPAMNLRVDAELARVQRAVRGALHREYVNINHRPAATPQDLLDGLNDLRPHVVHFSGHAGVGGVVMDSSDIVDPQSQDLDLKRLGRVLETVDKPPVLLVLNACNTAQNATDDLLPAVPVVIAMADSVLDEAAALFATQFYAAVAAGLSIKKAFDQGVLIVDLGGLDEESWMITLLHREDVDPDDVVLVRPPADMAPVEG